MRFENDFWIKWGIDIGAASVLAFFVFEFMIDGLLLVGLGGTVLVGYFLISPIIEIFEAILG